MAALGNLASTLATISTQSTITQSDRLTSHLAREAALVIEWSGASVPQDFLWDLAVMQRELMAWKKIFPIESARSWPCRRDISQTEFCKWRDCYQIGKKITNAVGKN